MGFKVERKRGAQWYAKYRLPDGRQVQRRIGPHWSDRSSPPPPGYFTKRTAQAWLDEVLVEARRGGLPATARPDATFAGACDEWIEWKRSRKVRPSTLADYQNMIDRIKPMVADQIGEWAKLEQVDSADVETLRDRLVAAGSSDRLGSPRLVPHRHRP